MRAFVIAFVALLATLSNAQDDCTLCEQIELISTDGIDNDLGRYANVWTKIGTYNGRALYHCMESACQGLRDELLFVDDQWQVRDCRPESSDACAGSHIMISSENAQNFPDSCPYDDIGPYRYCNGNKLINSDLCDSYATDTTAYFECVDVTPSDAPEVEKK